jgi:hypothetical protein
MADNYVLFSEALVLRGTKKEVEKKEEWIELILTSGSRYEEVEALKEYLRGEGIDEEPELTQDWPGFRWKIHRHEGQEHYLWMYSEEVGNIDHVASFAAAFLKKFDPGYSFFFAWAEICSKPRIGEFGGGAMIVSADGEKYLDTSPSAVNDLYRGRKAIRIIEDLMPQLKKGEINLKELRKRLRKDGPF